MVASGPTPRYSRTFSYGSPPLIVLDGGHGGGAGSLPIGSPPIGMP